jgi:hypothetical protein
LRLGAMMVDPTKEKIHHSAWKERDCIVKKSNLITPSQNPIKSANFVKSSVG